MLEPIDAEAMESFNISYERTREDVRLRNDLFTIIKKVNEIVEHLNTKVFTSR